MFDRHAPQDETPQPSTQEDDGLIIRVIAASRYLILLPIIGLVITASAMFIFGGLGLLSFLWERFDHLADDHESVIGVVEYIHFFLIGTVLYITAVGFYQLFIQAINVPEWLKIDSTDELETSLIGVSVVVLAVNFLGIAISQTEEEVLRYGAGIALPIAALGVFLWARAYSAKRRKPEDK